MPIPQEQAPRESTKVLIEESELAILRQDAARYAAVRRMDVTEFRQVRVAAQRGTHTFDELIDYRIYATPKEMRVTDGFPPVTTGNENPRKHHEEKTENDSSPNTEAARSKPACRVSQAGVGAGNS